MEALNPGSVRIIPAEFLAALITCETFADRCAQQYTPLHLENMVALQWVRAARCPIHLLTDAPRRVETRDEGQDCVDCPCRQFPGRHLLQCTTVVQEAGSLDGGHSLAEGRSPLDQGPSVVLG